MQLSKAACHKDANKSVAISDSDFPDATNYQKVHVII